MYEPEERKKIKLYELFSDYDKNTTGMSTWGGMLIEVNVFTLRAGGSILFFKKSVPSSNN